MKHNAFTRRSWHSHNRMALHCRPSSSCYGRGPLGLITGQLGIQHALGQGARYRRSIPRRRTSDQGPNGRRCLGIGPGDFTPSLPTSGRRYKDLTVNYVQKPISCFSRPTICDQVQASMVCQRWWFGQRNAEPEPTTPEPTPTPRRLRRRRRRRPPNADADADADTAADAYAYAYALPTLRPNATPTPRRRRHRHRHRRRHDAGNGNATEREQWERGRNPSARRRTANPASYAPRREEGAMACLTSSDWSRSAKCRSPSPSDRGFPPSPRAAIAPGLTNSSAAWPMRRDQPRPAPLHCPCADMAWPAHLQCLGGANGSPSRI